MAHKRTRKVGNKNTATLDGSLRRAIAVRCELRVSEWAMKSKLTANVAQNAAVSQGVRSALKFVLLTATYALVVGGLTYQVA